MSANMMSANILHVHAHAQHIMQQGSIQNVHVHVHVHVHAHVHVHVHVHVACACCPGWPAIPRPYRAWFPQRCCSRAPGSMTKPTACNPLGASSAPSLLAYSPRTCCALPARGPSDVFNPLPRPCACGTFATGIPQWRARLAPAAACRVLSCSEFTPNSHQVEVSGNILNSRPPGIHYPFNAKYKHRVS